MAQALYTLLVFLKFLAFMGIVYLGLHMLAARLVTRPDSKVLGFFALVTSPLTGAVRRFVPPGTPEPRLRALTMGVLVAGWLLFTALAVPLTPR
ncbi:MAG TPA: hypothetical protein VF406_08825 [Thermodesulfobacteriota bacterium]